MERSQILDMMGTLKLFGMRSAYDEIMASGIKRQHEPPRIVGDLLQSEIAEKQARSIKYQIAVAKLPLAKDIDDFDFTGTPVNEGLVRQLTSGAFLAEQHNIEIRGFGTFKIRQRKTRMARNPRTGDPVEVAARPVPVFKPSKELRAMVADQNARVAP